MPLVAARRERIMLGFKLVVSLFHIGMHLVEVGLRVLHILMQSVVTLLTALDRAVNRILYILAVLLVVLPGLLAVLAKRVGVLVRVLMQLLGVLLGGFHIRLDLLIRLVQVLHGLARLIGAHGHILVDLPADGGAAGQSVRRRCDFTGRSRGRQGGHADG